MHVRVVALTLLICVLAALASEGPRVSAQQRTESAIPATSNHPAALDMLSAFRGTPAGSPSLPMQSKDPKLDSHLVELAAAQLDSAAMGPPELPVDIQSMIKADLMRIDVAGRVQVYVQSVDDVASASAAVISAGGVVQRQDAPSGIVQALVPIAQVRSLATSPSVKFVRLPDYGVTGAGSVTTEGDSILKADLARADHGIDGSGVRVGVISGGDAGLSESQASGDLPSVNLNCDSVSNSNAEGTAMMEIVHDIAPGAQLWFAGQNTGLDFLADVDCLAANTDVVVDDVGFFNVGPYDGTNIISANTSAQFNNAGNPIRSYVTAVGNAADQHYSELYSACSSSTFQTFQATSTTVDQLGAGPQCFDPVFLLPGASMAAFLEWDDPWGASCNDYDIYLLDDTSGTIIASSDGPQSCSQNPAEELAWTNLTSNGMIVDIVIDNALGLAQSRNLELFTHGATLLNFDTPSSSVPNESDAGGGVISVGAIDAADPGNADIDYYSSLGPTNDNRTKPDITGIDCVSVTGDGGFPSPFCGTSAASPHIAGIAALLLQCKQSLLAGEPGDGPSADRNALRNALLSNAVDLGPAGMDDIYGAGRADARASADSLCPASTASPTPTHSPTPTPTHSPSPTPTHTPAGEIWGDLNCNGHVDAADAGAGLQALSGAPHAASACSPATDLDCSGQFDGADVLAILRYLVSLPITVSGCPAIGGPAP